MLNKSVFKLFANCLPVKGAKRSVICDLQYYTYKFIPNILFKILTEHKNLTMESIKSYYNNQYDSKIEEYFNTLIEEGLGFECGEEEIERYPDLNLNWERPEKVTNAIIDIDAQSTYDLSKFVMEIDSLRCKAVEVRLFSMVGLSRINEILKTFDVTKIPGIEILMPFDDSISEQALIELCELFPRINLITLFKSPRSYLKEINRVGVTINFIDTNITSAAHCGIINPAYFNVNQAMYREALKFNTCLNKKISIDVNGYIKNCPSMDKSYGQISQTNLNEVLEILKFKEYWNINKDEINICRDCEFRYICTDCRAYTQNLTVQYNKPLKCSYDPYLVKWGF
jgi:SPASM domain peptide maturase of grasp-with-spasm system